MAKTILITGTSSGIGRATALYFAERGWNVAATMRNPRMADPVLQHPQISLFALDVTNADSIAQAITDSLNRYKKIDVLLNNAGYGLFGAAEEVTDEQIDRQIATNLTGSIQVIRAALPHLRRQGGGRIVQVSSEGGQIAYPNFSLYHATKWGIEGFVESVAKEVAPFGIDFVIVEPGPTSTQFGAGLDHAVQMPEYDHTPAGDVRRAIASNSFAIRGDAGKTVAAMIVAAESAHPPLRLTLDSGAYHSISAALAERLTMLEAQKDIAFSADS